MKLKNGIMLLLAAFIWGTAFVAQSVGNEYMGPMTFLASRSICGVLFLVPVVLFKRRREGKSLIGSPKGMKKTAVGAVGCGLPLFLASYLQQAGMIRTEVGKSGFLTALYIILVPVFYFFITRKAEVKVWICSLIAACGIYFLCGTTGFSVSPYDLLLIGSAAVYAIQILAINHFSGEVDGVELSMSQFIVVSVLSVICMFILEDPAPDQIRQGITAILYAGVMSSGVAYTLQIVGQKDQNPTIASLLMSFESVFSVLAGMVVLHQMMTGRELLGCALMFAAIILTQIPVPGKKLSGLLVFFLLMLTGCGTVTSEAEKTALQEIQDRDFEAAEETVVQAEEQGENSRELSRLLALSKMGRGDYDSAAQILEEAISRSGIAPTDLDFDMNLYLAACYYKLGNPSGAEEIYDAILGLKPGDPDTLQLRGTVRISEGRTDEADSDFSAAIRKDPLNYDRLIEIYLTLSEYGCEDAGKELLQTAMNDSSDMGAYEKGRLAYYLEDYATAKSCLESARQGNEQDYKSTLLLGKTYEKLGNLDYAADVYEAYLAADQSHAEIYNELGICRLKAGDAQKALNAFQTGQKIRGNTIMQSLLYNEIVAYEDLGDFQKANLLMTSYLVSYPEDKNAQREQIFLSTR